jgi:hypothetical protein
MVFLMLTKHAPAICFDATATIDPEKYLALQAETVLHGLCRAPKAAE